MGSKNSLIRSQSMNDYPQNTTTIDQETQGPVDFSNQHTYYPQTETSHQAMPTLPDLPSQGDTTQKYIQALIFEVQRQLYTKMSLFEFNFQMSVNKKLQKMQDQLNMID